MGQCGGWEEQAAVFVVVGCCLALAAWESLWIGQNRPSVTYLAQICYSFSLSQRWTLGTFHLCPWDNLLLAGQRVYPFQTSVFLSLVFQRRGLLPGAGVRDLSTQEMATFGCLGDLAELELHTRCCGPLFPGGNSALPGEPEELAVGAVRSAEAFQLQCLQSPSLLWNGWV